MHALRIDVEADVEERHMAAIHRELVEGAAAPVLVPSPRGVRRRIVATLAVAFALLVPATAFAAEDTVPGDVLYPVKQSTEWVRSLVDPTVVQQHRVEELESVIARGASIQLVIDRFDASVEAVDDQEVELVRRVEQARERIRARYGVDLSRTVSRSRPGDPTVGDDTGDPRSGSQQGIGDGGSGSPAPNATIAPSTSTDGVGPESGTGAGTDDTTTPSTTRSATGQPDQPREPASGGNGR
jgi:hypothetical protein